MKNLIYALVLTVALSAYFSCFAYTPMENTMQNGFGTEYKGDTGLIIPGDGEEMAEINYVTDNNVGDKKAQTADKTEAVQKTSEETQETTKEIKEEHNEMDGMLLSFWHGVAAMLLGETAALMVAAAWMKIRMDKKEK